MDDSLIPKSFEQSLLQVATLASLNPTVEDIESLHAGIILQTLEELGRPADPDTISRSIRSRLGIAIPPQGIVEAIGKLMTQGDVSTLSDLRVCISPGTAAHLRSASIHDDLNYAA